MTEKSKQPAILVHIDGALYDISHRASILKKSSQRTVQTDSSSLKENYSEYLSKHMDDIVNVDVRDMLTVLKSNYKIALYTFCNFNDDPKTMEEYTHKCANDNIEYDEIIFNEKGYGIKYSDFCEQVYAATSLKHDVRIIFENKISAYSRIWSKKESSVLVVRTNHLYETSKQV